MASQYDEEALDGRESNCKSSKTRTLTTGTVDDNLGEIKDLEDELGIHDGMSRLLSNAETKDKLFEELLKQQRSQMLVLDTKERAYQKRLEDMEKRLEEHLACGAGAGRKDSSKGAYEKRLKDLEKKLEETDSSKKYPDDCYSFVALNGPEKGKAWTRQKILFFLFGFLPFIFQMVLLILLAFSQTNELRGTIEETDNPDQGNQGMMGLFAKFIPANSAPIIRVAQITSLVAYAIFPDCSLQDMVKAVQYCPLPLKKESSNEEGNSSEQIDSPDEIFYLRFSCLLRLTQGVTGMVVTLLLVLTSSTVVDIILNFTAVNFISGLDDDAFGLARSGNLGPALQAETERIEETDLPVCVLKKESKWKCHTWVAGMVAVFFMIMMAFVYASQDSAHEWVTQIFRVQFQDSTGLNQYSGCFDMNFTSSSVEFSRRIYHSRDEGSLSTSVGYCRQERQWILFKKGNTTDPCDAQDEEGLLLARSSKTDTFDISAMFEESWVSASNTPLDLYFFDGSNETEIREYCGLTLGDGRCDDSFNKLGYAFDGGDCCAATCTKPNCGRGGLTSVFGNSTVSGDGYESCEDPSMVPITIHLNSVTSSRDPKYTGWKQLSDATDQWQWDSDENQFIKWMNVEPVKTYFSLDCNGENVMTVYVDKSMVNQSQTVRVEDGASCSLVVRNTTTNLGIFTDEPIWYIDYTVFHGDATKRVEILSGDSSEVETMNFARISECYFRELGHHVKLELIYTGNSSSNQAINWLLGDPDPKQQCEDSNFLERYALVKMNSTLNPKESFIERSEQCRWPFATCNQGKVVSIQLPNQGLEGDIPSEIGLIANLEDLRLDNNEITSLPPQIGNLLSLQELYLYSNELTSLPAEIGDLSSLQELDLDFNQLQSLPAEIGNLSSLQTLYLSWNQLTSLPTEIGNLSSLQELYLYRNQLASLPAEIGNLSSLQTLYLYFNQLTSLPAEIGNLSSMQNLDLNDNQLSSLPTEIGDLSNLEELYLAWNQLTSLPTEIGNLSSLQELTLRSNELTSLPAEISDLSSLQTLNLYRNQLASLPAKIGSLSSLQTLHLSSNQLASLPAEIGNLSSLQKLTLSSNQLASLPAEIGNLSSLQKLTLHSNELTSLPAEIGDLSSLQELDLDQNWLQSLPTEIGNLSSLQELYLDGNGLTSLPTEVGNLSSLQELSLFFNSLTLVPTEIGSLASLQELWLDNNPGLTSLPTEIGDLSSLQTLYLNDNPGLTSLPTEIGTLSSLNFMLYDSNVTLPAEVIALCESKQVNCVAY